jgi:KaiC/GvpD/RAD55 family RecA-like ATPase
VRKNKKAPKKAIAPEKKEAGEQELISLLSPERKIYQRIESSLKELGEKFCAILMEKQSDYVMINNQLLKFFLSQGGKGIYVTVNKNISDLLEKFEGTGIDTKNVVFIDAISVMGSGEKIEGKNYHYLDSPKDLVEITLEIEKAANAIGEGKKFIIIDSLSTLLVYNKEATVERFVHSLSGKIRAWNAQGVLIVVESTKNEIVNTLGQFCDKRIVI